MNTLEAVIGLNGHDVYLCSQTGISKSLTFEIAPFVFRFMHHKDQLPKLPSSVIVISQLISRRHLNLYAKVPDSKICCKIYPHYCLNIVYTDSHSNKLYMLKSKNAKSQKHNMLHPLNTSE